MIVVHHLENSRSQRILWMLEELQIEYEIKRYARDKQTKLAPAALKKIHPLGYAPVMTDGDVIIAETGAIIEYLVEKTGKLGPAAIPAAQLRYRYWLHYGEGSAMPPLLMKLVFDMVAAQKMPFFAKPIAKAIVKGVLSNFIHPRIKTHLDFMEAELGEATWFVGDALTGADIMMSFPLEAAAVRGGLNADEWPNLVAFLARIHARPAYKRALERGGEYALMGSK